jgi:gamma-glutamyltranspeptidase / glutathione hydrolase
MVERPAASPSLLAGLSRRHGRATVRSRHSYTMGAVQALEISDSGAVVAAADPRRDGAEGRW